MSNIYSGKKIVTILCTLFVLVGCSFNYVNNDKDVSLFENEKMSDYIDNEGNIYVYVYGTPEKIDTPDSSIVDYIIYYEESKHLIVSLNGKEYIHSNVSSNLWDEFKNADSKGSYYNKVFKGNSNYWVVGYNGNNGSKINIIY